MLIVVLISLCQHPGGEEVLLEQAGRDLCNIYSTFYCSLFYLFNPFIPKLKKYVFPTF